MIESEEALLQLNVESFPHTKKQSQMRTIREFKSVFNKVVKPLNSGLADYQTVVNNFARKLYGRR